MHSRVDQQMCQDEIMLTQSWHYTNFDWLCIVRCTFWLANKKIIMWACIKKIYYDQEVNKQHFSSSVE